MIEASGTEFIGLCAKTYILWDEDRKMKKLACKGVMKKINPLEIENFRYILFNKLHTQQYVLNKNFKCMPNGEIFRYDQTKVGLNSLYCKRYVHPDMITTSNFNL